MACDLQSLNALELLMNEFFNNETTNERKHQIENILSNFGQQDGSWRHCLFYLTHTSNSYVSMFCLTTIENIINKLWTGLQVEDKLEIRTTLYRFVLGKQKTTPNYIQNKLVKLIVDIARLSWPHFYPDFLTNIMSLAHNPETINLCIIFLQMMSEELISSRAILSYSRKVELKRLLLQEVPSILSIITGFLESLIEKAKSQGITTPPPSPRQGNQSHSLANSGIGRDTLVNSMFHTFNLGKDASFAKTYISLPPMDRESEFTVSLCLSCLVQYFSWIPVSTLVNHQLLNAIFVFASAGADMQSNKRYLNGKKTVSPSEQDISVHSYDDSVGVLAMAAINEIFSKNCVPLDFEDFFLQTFKNTFHILQKLVFTDHESCNYLEVLNTEYLDKFCEFVRLIVSLHLRRFEDKEQFAVLEFFGLLFRYTFLQPNIEAYYNCLEIWSIFLDDLTDKCTDDQSCVLRYKEALLALAGGILQKLQFRFNHSELEELEHELTDDSCYLEDVESLFGDAMLNDTLTEWQGFLSNNLEVIAKIADLYPDQIFSLLFEIFVDTTKVYFVLQSNLSLEGTKPTLNLTSDQEYKSIHCSLRDLSSAMQAIGRLSILFLGENLTKRSSVALQVVSKLIEIANYSSAMKLFNIETKFTILQQDLIEVHAQVLSTLRAWTHWLSQLYGQQFVQVFPGGCQTHQYQDTCHSINKQLLLVAATVLECEASPLIISCATQLLSSLSVLMRSPVALDLASIQSLYGRVASLSIDLKVKSGLCRSLVNFLLLPWPSFISDHKLEFRKQHLVAFIHKLTNNFCSINIDFIRNDKTLQNMYVTQIIETLTIIRVQIDELNGADKNSRELYYKCVRHVIDHTILVFPVYINHSDVSEDILSLFVVSVQVLRNQIGAPKMMTFIQKFFDIFTENRHLYLAISLSDPTAIKVLEKFLRLLELIICEPGNSFQRFIPSTISLCMDNIYPSLAEKPSPELKGSLFKVIHCLLDRNWKYFYKSSVQSPSVGNNHWELCENEAHFVQIMQAFGQSFLQSDINIFKQNLAALESLNVKFKLYSRGAFKCSMLSQFITVLLQALVHKSHDILQEEIGTVIFHMAAVDFEGFFSVFLTNFLQQMDELTEDQKINLKQNFKTENDLPSFSQNNQRFVNDLRFYRICNESLPRGTVMF